MEFVDIDKNEDKQNRETVVLSARLHRRHARSFIACRCKSDIEVDSANR